MDAGLIAMRMRLSGGKQVAAEQGIATGAIKEGETAVNTANKNIARSSTGIRRSLSQQIASMRSIGRSMTRFVTLPILGVAAISGKFALDFDRNMRNVNSIAQLPERQFKRLKQSVLDLAGPTAQTPNTLAEGLYDLVSSGFDAAESIVILRKSALAASAGLTTTEVSTKAVAAALNAYHLPARKAGMVSDTLFETVNRGVLTFDELATTIGDALPFASQLSVNLGEVGAAISTMTKQGLSSAEAVTRYKNVLVTMLKPGEDLSKVLKDMGTSGEALVKKKGLQGALEAILAQTDGTKQAVAELFPNIRAMGGVLALTGKNAKFAGEDLEAFQRTTGATAKVLAEQEKSFGFQMQRAWASLQAVLIEIGAEVLPIVIPPFLHLVGILRDTIHWFSKAPAPIKRAAGELILLAALAGPMLYLTGSLAKATLAIQALFAAESVGAAGGGAGAAGLFAGAGPALAFIAILGLEVIAFTTLYNKVKWFRDATDAIWKAIGNQTIFLLTPIGFLITHFGLLKNAASDVGSFLSAAFNTAVRGAGSAIDAIGTSAKRLPSLIWAGLRQTPRMLGRFIGFWLTLPIRIGIIMGQLSARLPGWAVRAVRALWGGFKSAAPVVFRFWLSLTGRVLAVLASLPGKLAALGVKALTAMAKGVVHGATALFNFFRQLPSKLLSTVSSLAGRFASIGRKIASEMAKGFYEALPGPLRKGLGTIGDAAGAVGGAVGSVIPGGAMGFVNFPGGLALVGEQGPELVRLPRGADVIPAGPTRNYLDRPAGRPRKQPKAEAKGSPALQRLIAGDGRRGAQPPIVVKTYLNRRQIAEAVVEEQDAEDARA
jgi:TP901 family phage tail tape measure protein